MSDLRIRDSGGSDPALIFLCDPPVTIEAYDELIAEFQAHYRVLVVELPGFGFSKTHSANASAFAESVAAVEAALQSLQLDSCVLFGPCICGFVAAELVRRNQLPVKGLVLMQTPDYDGMLAWTERMDPKKTLRIPLLGQVIVRATAFRLTTFWLRFATGKEYEPDQLIAYCLGALHQGGGYPLATMLQLWGKGIRDTSLDIKAMAVWGMQDRSHRSTSTQSTCKHIPDAQIVEFEHCGHFTELEDPKGFADAVHPFLRSCFGEAGAGHS